MSTKTVPSIIQILSLSINTARRAGKIIRETMEKGNLGIVDKGKDDLQTEADRTAQKCIIGSLSRKFPNINIIGEEGTTDLNVAPDLLVTEFDGEFIKENCPKNLAEIKEEDVVVWVDPLDGTSEYTQGFLEHVTVLIGIAVKGDAVGGVIYQPYFKQNNGNMGRIVWGLKGLGIGGLTPKDPPQDQFIVTTTRSHSNSLVQAALDSLHPTTILRVGGAGYKVLQLLEGAAHAYVFASAGCKKWDTCAPEAVLAAHGGTLTDVCGVKYIYNANVDFPNRHGVIATAKNVDHADIIRKIPMSVKDSMTL